MLSASGDNFTDMRFSLNRRDSQTTQGLFLSPFYSFSGMIVPIP